jgi:phage gpG-like protein
MAEPVITIDYDLKRLKEIPKLMKDIERNGGNVKKPLKRWGVYELRQTDLTFEKQGRGTVRWKPLAEVTKIMRRYRKRGRGRTGPKKALQDTGHLKRSVRTVTFKQGKTWAQAVFTRTPYAETHQEGGTMIIPARTIVAKKAKALKFMVGGETLFRKKVHIPEQKKKVPARPFLFIAGKDRTMALKLVREHAQEVTSGATKNVQGGKGS